MQSLSTAHAVAQQAVEFSGLSLCAVMHVEDEYEVAMQANGSLGTHTIGNFVQPPTDTFSLDLVGIMEAPTEAPPRVCQLGVSDLTSQTGSTFTPLTFPAIGPPQAGVFSFTMPTVRPSDHFATTLLVPLSDVPPIPAIGPPFGLPPARARSAAPVSELAGMAVPTTAVSVVA